MTGEVSSSKKISMVLAERGKTTRQTLVGALLPRIETKTQTGARSKNHRKSLFKRFLLLFLMLVTCYVMVCTTVHSVGKADNKYPSINSFDDGLAYVSSSPRIAFMIPSGRRPKGSFYAIDTVLGLKHSGVPSSSVLVFNAEGDGKNVELENMRDKTLVKEEYSVHWVVRPPGTSFSIEPKWASKRLPDLKESRYREAAGDNPQRKRWRTKEVQDFMFVSKHALKLFPESEWFVFLQDDAVYDGDEGKIERKFDAIFQEPEVVAQGFAHLNPMGNVALLMHRTLLMSFLGFAEIRFHLIPIDWILEEFLSRVNGKKVKPYVTPMFKHIGKISSFEGNKVRKVE